MQLKYKIDRVAIGRRLKDERLRLERTQEKMSEEIGITMKYLSKVENGTATPSLPFIIKFSEITGSDLNYLLRGIDSHGLECHGGLMKSASNYDAFDNGLTRKGRKVFSELMRIIIKVLEDNKV